MLNAKYYWEQGKGMLDCSTVECSKMDLIYECTLDCVHAINFILTFVINNVHCSNVWHSTDYHCLHFWRHCQFSNKALNTLSDAVIDCAVLHCGHATAYLKNDMPLSTLVVFRAYTGDRCVSTYNVSIQEMSPQETAVF